MTYNDAVTKIRGLMETMQQHADAAERASRTYTAMMELYNVASSANDEKGMQNHRDALHTTVDVILDSGAMIEQLKRDIAMISKSVTTFPTQF